MPKILSTLAGLLLVLAGCVAHGPATKTSTSSSFSSTTSQTANPAGPCSPRYYVGCDNNPDAREMLNRFGLHQITNTTHNPIESRMASGLVSWMGESGGGYFAYNITLNRSATLSYPKSWGPNAPYPSGCCVLYSQMPDSVEYKNSQLFVWNPTSGELRQVPLQYEGPYVSASGGFDGKWALLQVLNKTQLRSLVAANTEDGTYRLLPQEGPHDQFHTSRHIWQSLSTGSAFVSYYNDSPGNTYSTLVETNLTTGQERTLLVANKTAIDYFDSSPKYLVASTFINDVPGMWVMSRANGTWWDIQKIPGADGINPVIDGDWCVYYEKNPGSKTWPGGLVGIYLPTGKRYELAPNPNGLGYVSWDTDGHYLVASIQVDSFTVEDYPGYPYQQEAKYPGDNIYWKELPKVT